MASFVIHNIAGEFFLQEIQKKLNLNLKKEDINKFLMGNLIPDSSRINFIFPSNVSEEELINLKKQRRKAIQNEKISTHFRNTEENSISIESPNLDKFIEKYNELFSRDFSVLGYFFHLYTDTVFFKDLFEQTFTRVDEFGNPYTDSNKSVFLKLKKDNKRYPISEIFSQDSEDSIYHDYTKMNALFLNKYKTTFDYNNLVNNALYFINPGIEEVDYQNIIKVLNETESYIRESYSLTDYTLKVFDEDVISDFIPQVVDSFIKFYEEIILRSIRSFDNISLIKKLNI